MDETRHGPGHPIALLATAVLLLNDHVLRWTWPGVVTGKLSDFAWLVVAPVALAAALAWIGVPARAARGGAVGAVAAVYVLLQLWPPLGDAITAWTYGGRHVADVEDLIALPALLLVPSCWRPSTPSRRSRLGSRVALPIAAFACVATRSPRCESGRTPEDGDTIDPTAPLGVSFGLFAHTPADTEGVMAAMHVIDANGDEVELVATTTGNAIWLCPVGGLEPNATYTWRIDEIQQQSGNHWPANTAPTGTTTFSTSGGPGAFAPADDEVSCRQLVDEANVGGFCADTGMFADTADTDVDTDDTDTGTDTDDTDGGDSDAVDTDTDAP